MASHVFRHVKPSFFCIPVHVLVSNNDKRDSWLVKYSKNFSSRYNFIYEQWKVSCSKKDVGKNLEKLDGLFVNKWEFPGTNPNKLGIIKKYES